MLGAMSLATVEPNAEHGNAATRIAKVVRDRKSRSTCVGRPAKQKVKELRDVAKFQGEYEAARVSEVETRASLYRAKFERERSGLLDRELLKVEIEAAFKAIRTILAAFPLTACERQDWPVDEILADVASRRNREANRSNGDGNHHSLDEIP
jgi:hypothetical protein